MFRFSIILLPLVAVLLTQNHAALAGTMEQKPQNCKFRGYAIEIPDRVWQQMNGRSWHAGMGCPARNELSYLRVQYHDFNMQPRMGELVVARSAATNIIKTFQKLFCSNKFAIHKMKLVHNYDGNDRRSMNDNNTSGFNCRKVAGGRRMSEHSYGLAIDINPVQNPYVSGRHTSPPSGAPYDTPKERSAGNIGIIRNGEVVVNSFRAIGWKWGGNWRKSKDYQHFSRSGR